MPGLPTNIGAIARAAALGRGRRGVHRVAGAAAAALLLVSLAHTTPALAGDLSPSVPAFRPHFPVFGGGKLVNIFDDDAALTNASAHVAWSLAVPLLGERLGGRKGLWVSGLSWIALSLAQEALFHAPPNPGAGYPSEVRADLITRIVPCASLLVWDLVRGGRPPKWNPRAIPGRLLSFRADLLPPDRADQLLREAALRMPSFQGRRDAPGAAPLAPAAATRGATVAATAPTAAPSLPTASEAAATSAQSLMTASGTAATPSPPAGAPPPELTIPAGPMLQ
jgi:hypothetical protein